ncbi:MAG: hypothetical protein UY26_C0003G0306 [Candidatus Jorgensenbacteria bacterium GW2011_GWA1_48_13]|uniref:Uncharacterized protein n=2 Tax=Candidatus Joergenseniibacteriota TaxID=1752739 RepID=A0A0G1W7Q9_9BACT|nr:MAG: hypothetical protein UY26_C0003G0306 [Candidatus Jorgensenbacteria bacterium GW2011_GWA1_48_13]KKU99235.1 MAG: hypothetical protein UY32_C0003G0005 [Candidatus Jorgensenbacteria bacterium GW2011_GWC1_48_8]KKW14806.1 MAG: hypothetical protein UY55_C0003G0022 [Candidatus Jorgensenbacteria bacterium GW2011_GWB1_50_10]
MIFKPKIRKKLLFAIVILGLVFGNVSLANYLYYDAGTGRSTFSNTVEVPGLYSSGNVGIGTASPGYKLDVKGISATRSANNDNLITVAGYNGTAGGYFDVYYDNNLKIHLSAGPASGDTYFLNSNVGIGTTGPGAKLDVAGTTRSQRYDLSNSGSMDNTWTAGGVGSWRLILPSATNPEGFGAGAGGFGIYNNTDLTYHLIFGNNGTQTFGGSTYFPGSGIWNSSGNVGIGTTGPNDKLSVSGSIGIEGGTINAYNDATLYVTANNNNDWGLVVNKYNAGSTEYGVDIRMADTASYALRVLGSGSEKFRVDGAGNLFITGGARAELGLPDQWYSRRNITTDTAYWTGSQGWGYMDMNSTLPEYGSTFFDIWGTGMPGNPFGAGYSHFQGLQAYHYWNGTTGHGSQLVFDNAGYGGTAPRMYMRSIWGGGWGGWVGICMANGTNCPAAGDTTPDTIADDGVITTGEMVSTVMVEGENISLLTNNSGYITDGNTGWDNSYGYITPSGNVATADKVNGYSSGPDNSHPGTGMRPFYSWALGCAYNGSGGCYSNGISVGSHPSDQAYGFQIVQNMWDDRLYFRRYNGGWQDWFTVIDSGTIGSQSVNYAASAGSVAWGNVTGRQTWLTASNLIEELSNFNSSRPSGFYQGYNASNAPGSSWYNMLNVRHSNTGNDHGFQIAASYYDENVWTRTYQGGSGADNGTFTPWKKLVREESGGGVIVGTGGTSSNSRTLTILNSGSGQVNFGQYPGNWTSALQIQSSDATPRFLWMAPLDANSSANARIVAGGTNLDIYVGASAGSGGSWSATFNSSGKIDVSTVDPVYTIGGTRYATYMAGMTGVKEETTGVINLLTSDVNILKYVIDFNKTEVGSDLWLFAQAINVDGRSYIAEDGKVYRTTAEELFNNFSVLLTPNFAGNVWYEKDVENRRITILAIPDTKYQILDTNYEVSYRLTAPRFDWKYWTNYSNSNQEGLNLDKSLR